jgi:uncharacterized RDD family membrane protein YckC
VARGGRRILAILVDWAIATAISLLVFPPAGLDGWEKVSASNPAATLGAFAILQVVFISTLGGSIGHLLFGLRLVPLQPAWIGVLKPLIRTVLLCLFVPAVIFDKDQRGLHDLAAKTLLVRR